MELIVRFALGGLIVSLFSVAGELFKPKTFTGLFGAAPSVAVASLALAFHGSGADYVATESRSMVIGSLALLLYGVICVRLAARTRLPVWLGAGAAWGLWFAAAMSAYSVARSIGVVE